MTKKFKKRENKNFQNWLNMQKLQIFHKNWLHREQKPFEEKNRYKEQNVNDEIKYVTCLKGCQATS